MSKLRLSILSIGIFLLASISMSDTVTSVRLSNETWDVEILTESLAVYAYRQAQI